MKKDKKFYMNLPWSYTIEQVEDYYIIRVNELPGIVTDNESLDEGMKDIKMLIGVLYEMHQEEGKEMPEPIDPLKFKGNISYRTDKKRHYRIAQAARRMHKSISKTMDELIDSGLERIQGV